MRFDYDREDFKDFEDKVKVTADFIDSEVALNDLNTFYNEFGYWSFQYNDFTRITTLSYTEQVWLFLAFIIAVSIKTERNTVKSYV